LEKLKAMGINVDLLIHVALYKQIVVFSSGRHDIAEILLKVALKHQKSNQIKSNITKFK
jgi:hypothetical protein